MYLTHPDRPGQSITVPDAVGADYIEQGWVQPGVEFVDPLDSMTNAQLRQHAETQGIDLGKARVKADLLAAIRAASR